VTGAAPAYALSALASAKRDRSSPISASTRAPVRDPSPGRLVMISASGCWPKCALAAAARAIQPKGIYPHAKRRMLLPSHDPYEPAGDRHA
jgi:hypothetical protein